MSKEKRFVYVLRSFRNPNRPYVGLTSDVRMRLSQHNAGESPYTAQMKPWELVVALEFQNQPTASRFEKYLKSGSGRAFAARHFGFA